MGSTDSQSKAVFERVQAERAGQVDELNLVEHVPETTAYAKVKNYLRF